MINQKNILKKISVALLLYTSFAFGGSYEDGLAAYVEGDYKKAHKNWSIGASYGDADAQNSLGNMYYNGIGVNEDIKKAIYYYRLAASNGSIEAKRMLGLINH